MNNNKAKKTEQSYGTVLLNSIDEILKQAKIINTLDSDPSISEEDKEKICNQGNNKIDLELEKIEKAKKGND